MENDAFNVILWKMTHFNPTMEMTLWKVSLWKKTWCRLLPSSSNRGHELFDNC